MKKVLIFVCLIMLALLLVSCSQNEVPEGYQLVCSEGDEFRLYVPASWQANAQSGVTGAYTSMSDNTAVNVYVADDAGDMTVDEYWTVCEEKLKDSLDGYEYDGKTDAETGEKIILGGQAAKKYRYKAKMSIGGTETVYRYVQVIAKYKEKTYILLFSATEKGYDANIDTFEGYTDSDGAVIGIIPYFEFKGPYVSDDEKDIDDKVEAPEGMKIISTEEQSFRFFVPNNWIVDKGAEIASAYFSETDRSNVTLQGYMSDENYNTIDDCWVEWEKKYTSLFGEDYVFLSSSETDKNAKTYVFTVEDGGVKYKIMQTFWGKGAMVYTFTYTALEENFDLHTDDVAKMIENFEAR